METEVWKKLEGFDFEYEVSSFGKVKNISTGHIYKGNLNNKGYVKCQLKVKGKYKNFSIHRLVMLGFIGKSDLQVNHKNGIKTDNGIHNLEYVTPSDNMKHSYYALGRKKSLRFTPKGVIQLTKKGEFVNQFNSLTEAQQITQIGYSAISKCCNGKKDYKTAGGFRWVYS